MARNVLIVSTVEHAEDVLRAHLGPADTIKVVVPVVRQGVLDWLANDEQAFGRAERVAEHTAAALPGETVDSSAGQANVGLAIRDALATFPADEIVVAVVERGGRARRVTRHRQRAAALPRWGARPLCRNPGLARPGSRRPDNLRAVTDTVTRDERFQRSATPATDVSRVSGVAEHGDGRTKPRSSGLLPLLDLV